MEGGELGSSPCKEALAFWLESAHGDSSTSMAVDVVLTQGSDAVCYRLSMGGGCWRSEAEGAHPHQRQRLEQLGELRNT